MTLKSRYNVFRPSWENLPWRKILKWENEHDSILPLQLKLLELTLKNTIKQDSGSKIWKKHLSYQLKTNHFLNYSWWILCRYYLILIKPTGSNRFIFLKALLKLIYKVLEHFTRSGRIRLYIFSVLTPRTLLPLPTKSHRLCLKHLGQPT